MKALIVIRADETHWVHHVFPGMHPAMLPLCNKPMLEYLVDFASLNGCEAVRIILEEPGKTVESWFGNGLRAGIEISYADARPGEAIDRLLAKNNQFCRESSLLIFDGYFFLHYDQFDLGTNWLEQKETGLLYSCPGGMLLYAHDNHCLHNLSSTKEDANFKLASLQSVGELFKLSQQILYNEAENYVLPSYDLTGQILLGRNIHQGARVKLIGPLIIGDNARIESDTTIGPGAIIGSGTIIDAGTEVSHSIVLADGYLGRNLSLREKILFNRQLISPEDGSQLSISDPFLVAPMAENPSLKLLDRFVALMLIFFQAPPYLLLQVACRLQGDWQIVQRKVFSTPEGKVIRMKDVITPRNRFFSRLFRALSLQRFPYWGAVLRGRLALVGNHPLTVSQENRQLLKDFPEYLPGVFSYSEADNLAVHQPESEVSERFYSTERGVRQTSRLLVRAAIGQPDKNKTTGGTL